MEKESISTKSSLSSSHYKSENLEWQLNLKEIFEIFDRKKFFLVVAVLSIAVLTCIYHYTYPSYTVTSYLFFEDGAENGGLQALLGSLDDNEKGQAYRKTNDEKILLSLKSSKFNHRFLDSIKADPDYKKFEPILNRAPNLYLELRGALRSMMPSKSSNDGRAPKYFGKNRSFSFRKNGILQVTFSTLSPELSVFLTNHFLDTAVRSFSTREKLKIEQARDYIQGKIEQTIEKIEKTDQTIVGLNTKNAALSLLAPQSAIAERLLKLKSEIQNVSFRFEQNKKFIDKLKRKATKDTKGILTAPQSVIPPLASATDKSVYGVKRTISNLEVENELLAIRKTTLKQGLKELLKSNLPLPKAEQDLADLKRQKSLDYFVFDNLFKTLLQIEVKGLSLLNKVTPLQKMSTEDVFVSMGLLKRLILSIFFALVLTAILIYLHHLSSPVIRSKRDFATLGTSFLGNIPTIQPFYFENVGTPHKNICNFNLDSKETISFKHIRSRLVYLANRSGSEPRKVISLLSYGNGEGKSFLSSNLASCFAHSGKKTLLIDFDLRRTSLSKQFNCESKLGLCSYLDRGLPLKELVIPSIIPYLDFLPAGTLSEKTTEQFSNQRFRELTQYLKPIYDFIIIDTAPILVAHESLPIAQDSDFAVLSTTSWKTKKEDVVDVVEEIRNVRKGAIHFLVNKTKETSNKSMSNYYYSVGLSKSAGRVFPGLTSQNFNTGSS